MKKSGSFLLASLMLLFSVSCSNESSYSIDNLDVVEFSKLGEAQLKGIKEITVKIDQAKESLVRL